MPRTQTHPQTQCREPKLIRRHNAASTKDKRRETLNTNMRTRFRVRHRILNCEPIIWWASLSLNSWLHTLIDTEGDSGLVGDCPSIWTENGFLLTWYSQPASSWDRYHPTGIPRDESQLKVRVTVTVTDTVTAGVTVTVTDTVTITDTVTVTVSHRHSYS